MDKLWTGRFSARLDQAADDFNSSIRIDERMYRQDINGSIAHAKMLNKQGIISGEDCEKIILGLNNILTDINSGDLIIDSKSEDIHSFIEGELTLRIGESGKRLHTARSRNDQVALDCRLYLREECDQIIDLIKNFINVLIIKAQEHAQTVMCGYTHLQRAQPITFGHHLLAYCFMLLRDIERILDCKKRINISPLGACALAGTTFNTDRQYAAELLGMNGVCLNSLDAVSDRDFTAELAFDISLLMTHLSRLSEEVILWCSWEFKYIELSDKYSTGSSIMPQKKNADIAELIRGKTGRTNGNLVALLTMLKGLPLAYNKDMQEDKELIFDSVDTVKACLNLFAPMIETMTVIKENMRSSAEKGFINATDCADYLTLKGLPFRTAYKITGEIVAYCIKNNKNFEGLTIEEYHLFSDVFDKDIYQAVDLDNCVSRRISQGGTGLKSIKEQLTYIKKKLRSEF